MRYKKGFPVILLKSVYLKMICLTVSLIIIYIIDEAFVSTTQ